MTNPNPARRKNIKPGLNVPAGLSPELDKFLQSVKEHLQGADGTRGVPTERFVTLDDLERIGLVVTGVKNGRGVITKLNSTTIAENATSGGAGGGGADLLSELDDVDVATVHDLDVLRYNAAAGKWFASDQVALLDRDAQVWTGQNIYRDTDADQIIVGQRIEMDQGYVALSRATGADAPGYVGFYDSLDVRKGYVGFHSGNAYLTLTSEDAWGVKIDSTEDLLLEADTYTRLIQATGVQIGSTVNLPTTLVMNGTVPYINIGGSAANESFVMLQRYNNAGGGPDIAMYHSRSASVGTHTILQSGDEIGSISFYASDGTSTPIKVARIIGFVNGTVGGATDLPSRLDFLTTPDGSVTSTRTLRLSPERVETTADVVYINNRTPLSVPAASLASDSRLLIIDDTSTAVQQLKIGTGSMGDRFIAAGGTFSVPTAIDTTNTTYMGYIGGAGYDGTTWITDSAGLVGIRPVDTWSGTQRPTRVTIETTPLASTTRGVTASFDPAEIDLTATLLDFNGNVDVSGSGVFGGNVTAPNVLLSNTSPTLVWTETDATAGNQRWDFSALSESLNLRVVNDTGTLATNIFTVQRTANTVDSFTLGATSFVVNGTEVELNVTTLDFNATLDVDGGAHDIDGSTLQLGANTTITLAAREYVFNGEANDYSATVVNPMIYVTSGGGAGDFLGLGHMIFHTRTTAPRDFIFRAGTTPANIVRFYGDGSEVEFNVTTFDMNGAIDVSGVAAFGARVVSQNSFQALGSATTTGVNAIHAIMDVNGGVSRFISYNWGTAAVQPLAITGSTVTITSNSLTSIVNSLDVSGNLDAGSGLHNEFAVGGTRVGVAGAATNALFVARDSTNNIEGIFGADTVRVVAGSFTAHEFRLRTGNTDRIILASDGSEIQFDATTFDMNGALDLSGAATLGGNLTVSKSGPVVILTDTAGTTTDMLAYVSMRDSGGVERGWMGYGSDNDDLWVSNSIGDITLSAEGVALVVSTAGVGWGGGAAIASSDDIGGSFFTLDVGGGVDASGMAVGDVMMVAKDADETRTTTTLSNDTDLSFTSVPAGTYVLEYGFDGDNSAASGINGTLVTPTLTSHTSTCTVQNANGTASHRTGDWIDDPQLMSLVATSDEWSGFGSIVITFGTGGNITMQWAQQTATGTSTIKAGSWLRLTRIL